MDSRISTFAFYFLGIPVLLSGNVLNLTSPTILNIASGSPDSSTSTFESSPGSSALVRFDDLIGNGANQIPMGSTINTATLTFDGYGTGDTAIHRMLSDWDSSLTWNNATLGGNTTSGIQADDTEASSNLQLLRENTDSDASIYLENSGTYNAEITLSYDFGGNTVTPSIGDLLSTQSTTLTLPGGATNVNILVETAVFAANVFDLNYLTAEFLAFELSGIVFDPDYTILDPDSFISDTFFEYSLDVSGDLITWAAGDTNAGWALLDGLWEEEGTGTIGLTVDFTPAAIPEAQTTGILLGLSVLIFSANRLKRRPKLTGKAYRARASTTPTKCPFVG